MNKVITKGIVQTQPSFSFMQNETSGMAICKSFASKLTTDKKEKGSVFPLICFDDLAYYMRNNLFPTDVVELHGYFKDYKSEKIKNGLDKVLVVTEIVDRKGNIVRNDANVEEKSCEEMVTKGFSLIDINSNYFY